MNKLQQLLLTKQEIEIQVEEERKAELAKLREIERERQLKEREEQQRERDNQTIASLDNLYKEVEGFLGAKTSPKLIWLLTVLLSNRGQYYVNQYGVPMGQEPVFNYKDISQKLETINRVLENKKG